MSSSPTRPRATVLRGDAASRATGAFDVITKFDPVATRAALNPAEAAEAARLVAFEQGYNDGLEAARRDVEAATDEANKRVRRALAALCEAVDSFDSRQTIALADVEDAVVSGAFELARAVLGREVVAAADPGADAIARALLLAPERGDVVARLHPDDAATLAVGHISTSSRTVTVVADPGVEPGGCIVDAGETRIDAQLSSAMAKVATVLFGTLGANQLDASIPVPERTVAQQDAGSALEPSRTTAVEAPLP